MITRISLHKNLYHTLFESHLCYGITSWEGVPESKLRPLFKIQKICIRILFGNKEKYLNKFKTCCRVRPVEDQILGQQHYRGVRRVFERGRLRGCCEGSELRQGPWGAAPGKNFNLILC